MDNVNLHYLSSSFFHTFTKSESAIISQRSFHPDTLSASVRQENFHLKDLPKLLALTDSRDMALLLDRAKEITHQRFGNIIHLYAPLYVSNTCASSCTYCGFSTEVRQKRVTLSLAQVEKEALALVKKGFRQVLIVSGEFKVKNKLEYFLPIVSSLSKLFDSVHIEIQALSVEEYEELYRAGLDGVTMYQEVYHQNSYSIFHQKGAKSDSRYRIEAPERIAKAGIPSINLGILLGLNDWRTETLLLAAHLDYLQKNHWQVRYGLSFPRIVEEGIHFNTPYKVSELDLVKIIASMRLVFPDVPISLSTRESPRLRDMLMSYGITQMSAESKTMPGGYAKSTEALAQFQISDERKLSEVIAKMQSAGKHPVFKDWDSGFRE
jgi:2-iminoacetate synthase